MRKVILGFVLLLTLGDSCNNNIVGVQDYGGVTGRVLDATTNRPIANALVSVGSLYTATADANGVFILSHVPIGLQSVTARMPGFTTDSAPIRVHKDRTESAGYLRLVPIAKPESQPTLPPPATPTPTVSIEPTWTPPGATAAAPPSPAPAASPSPAASASP